MTRLLDSVHNTLVKELEFLAMNDLKANSKDVITFIKMYYKSLEGEDMTSYELLPLLAFFIPYAEYGLNNDAGKFAKRIFNYAVKTIK